MQRARNVVWIQCRYRNRTHDLPNTGRALYPLSYAYSWRARQARVMLINSPFTFRYRAQNLPSYSLVTIQDDFGIVEPSSMQDACQI